MLLFLCGITIVASETDPEGFGMLVRYFGVPGALFAVLIVALVRGVIITGREAQKDIATWKDRYEEMKKERDYWRDSAMKNMEALERTTDTAHKAVIKIAPSPTTL